MAPREQIATAALEHDDTPTTKRILICGAGPAGLLASIFLLRRNLRERNNTRYQVTLVDPGVDYGKLDESGLSRFRSWMIGLSAHGLTSIKEVPGLYEDYVETLGVQINSATFALGGSMQFTQKRSDKDFDVDAFCVDRNFICGALARYLNDNFGSGKSGVDGSKDFVSYYNTKALFVDVEKRQVMIRETGTESSLADNDGMVPLEYDILLGCDGIRSITRNAFLTNHRDFEFDITGNFGTGKSIHLTRPKDIDEGHFMILVNCLPNVFAFILPERGGQLNFGMGWSLNKPGDPELLSDDPKVVTAYLKKKFQGGPFNKETMDFEEFGQRWVDQGLTDTQFVHCNFYHSMKLKALLLGDAAHATVPNIGQGMNTALADASALNMLLDEHEDDWDEVLPAFSQLRVKEGNALSELSFHTFSLDPGMQFSIMMRQNIHRMLNKVLPEWLLEKEPMGEIAKGGKLSVAYNKMVQYGYLAKSRQKNNSIKRDYFERQVGMTTPSNKSSGWLRVVKLIGASTLVAGISYGIGVNGISFSN